MKDISNNLEIAFHPDLHCKSEQLVILVVTLPEFSGMSRRKVCEGVLSEEGKEEVDGRGERNAARTCSTVVLNASTIFDSSLSVRMPSNATSVR